MKLSKLTLCALCILLFNSRSYSAIVYGPTIYKGDVSVGSWVAHTNITAATTSGGAYTNAAGYTNYYRFSGTNPLGRIPLTSNIVVSFVGSTNATNAVLLTWRYYAGLTSNIIERSYDAGATWTNWYAVRPTATNWTDLGTNALAGTNAFINAFPTLIPSPSVPWSGGASATNVGLTDLTNVFPANVFLVGDGEHLVPTNPSGARAALELGDAARSNATDFIQTLQEVCTHSTGGTNTSIFAMPGQSLAALYQIASALTPNGAAISSSNRASLIVYPGTYPLAADLVLSNEYVDVVSATGLRDVLLTGNTIDLQATNVTIRGLDVGTAQYIKMATARAGLLIDNCRSGAAYDAYWDFKVFSGTICNSTFGAQFCVNIGEMAGTIQDSVFGLYFCTCGTMSGKAYYSRFADVVPKAASGAGAYVGCVNGNGKMFGDYSAASAIPSWVVTNAEPASVTPDMLSNTTVTAGTYTNPIVTFDADGRATSVLNGSPGGVTLTGFELAVDSSDWFGWETGQGSTTNNAIVATGYSVANATNNINSGYSWFSGDTVIIQDKYSYARLRIPSYASDWATTALVVRVRTESTGITTNKINLLFDDEVNTHTMNSLVSTVANEWREYIVLKTNIADTLGAALDRPAINIRADSFSWRSNDCGFVEIYAGWE
jgi:hypothetical protein